MDVIDTICNGRLVLSEILTERRRQLLNVLRNIEVVNLENLGQHNARVLQLKEKRYCGHEELRRS